MPDPATPVPEKSSCTKRYSCFFAVSVRCHRTETYTGWWYTSKKGYGPTMTRRMFSGRMTAAYASVGSSAQRTSLRGRWGSRSSSR